MPSNEIIWGEKGGFDGGYARARAESIFFSFGDGFFVYQLSSGGERTVPMAREEKGEKRQTTRRGGEGWWRGGGVVTPPAVSPDVAKPLFRITSSKASPRRHRYVCA